MHKGRNKMSFPGLASDLKRAAFGLSLLTAVAAAQETTRVSVSSSGAQGNHTSYGPSISVDGQFVAFMSLAQNLVGGDTNATWDVFVHDRSSGLTERVSVDSSGAEGNSASYDPSISSDGQFVAYHSQASNLVPGDTNSRFDVFVHDRSTGLTERISVDSSGAEGNGDSAFPSISADGRFVAFESHASNLVSGDANGFQDVFVRDRSSGLTERVSVNSSGAEADNHSNTAAISADGQIIAMSSDAANLVAGDTNGWRDVFVHDRTTKTTERVSVDSSGVQGNNYSDGTAISADGQVVAFWSYSDNLVAGGTNGWIQVYVHDRFTALTELASVDSSGNMGNNNSYNPSISADGQIIAFESNAWNLVTNDTNGDYDIFVRDWHAGFTERVSVDSSGAEASLGSYFASISADGQIVAFSSFAWDLVFGDTNGYQDVFVRERCDATWTNYGAGFPGTNGVPSFTSRADPILGTTVTLDLGSSYGAPSTAFVLVGYSETLIPTTKGGDLLVVPAFTIVLPLPAIGTTIDGDLPDDDALCGFEVFAQGLELDPGATKRLSFTAGLKLVLGH